MTRRKTTRWLTVGGIALIVIGVALGAFIAGAVSTAPPAKKPVLTATVATPGKGSAHQAVQAVVPARPAELMTTPPTADWWADIAAMFPGDDLPKIQPLDAGVKVVGFAYSLNATQGKNAKDVLPLFPAVYAETTSTEDAQHLTDWFNAQPGADTRRAWRDGTVAIVAPSYVDQGAEFTLDTKSSTSALAKMIGQPDPKAVWTFDLGRYDSVLLGSLSDDVQKQRVQEMFTALGLTGRSTLTVTASDPAGEWTGAARDIVPSAVNVQAVGNLINGSGQVQMSQPQADGTRIIVRARGMDDILTNGTFTGWVKGVPANTIGYAADKAGQTLRANNANTVLSGRIFPMTWENAIRGMQADRRGATSIEFAIGGDGTVVLKPDFGHTDAVLPMPAGAPGSTLSPPVKNSPNPTTTPGIPAPATPAGESSPGPTPTR